MSNSSNQAKKHYTEILNTLPELIHGAQLAKFLKTLPVNLYDRMKTHVYSLYPLHIEGGIHYKKQELEELLKNLQNPNWWPRFK